MEVEVKTLEFWGWYAALETPRAFQDNPDGQKKYSILAMFPLGADLSGLKNAASKAMQEKFKDQASSKAKHPKFKSPFREQGDLVDEGGHLKAGAVVGAICVTLSNKVRPSLFLPDKTRAAPDQMYSGAHYVAKLGCYAWLNGGVPGVSFNLLGLQLVKHGERLGGTSRLADADDFDPVAGAEDGADASSLFD